jgi:hypothetical protein
LQIIFENTLKNDRGMAYTLTVDGTDCAIWEACPWESSFNWQLFLEKNNEAVVIYKV